VRLDFFPTGVRFFKNFKLEGFVASTFLSMFLLFLTCSVYSKDYWCFIAALGTLLGYFLFFFPFIFFKKVYLRSDRKFFTLSYSAISLALTIALLATINGYVSYDFLLGLKITIYCFAPLLLAGFIALLPLNKPLKSSLIVLESGLFSYGLNYVLNKLLEPTTTNIYKINFADWELCNNGNVSFIILLTSIVAFLVLFILGFFKSNDKRI